MAVSLWLVGGGTIGALALSIGAFFFGRDVGRDAVRAEMLEQVAAADAKRRDTEIEMGKLRLASVEREQARQGTMREIYREVPTVIDRPVYRNDCIDADGVQLLDRAADAANSDRPRAAGDAGGTAGDAADGGSRNR